MFKNYLKIAWRNLIKNKVYSFINQLGLSVGIAVALLIGLWIWDEVSYNKNFDNYNHIVRVKENSTHGGQTDTWNSMPIPLAGALRTQYASDFKTVSLASWNGQHILAFGEKKLSKNGMFVQPDFINIFSIKTIKGVANGLNDPSSIEINSSLAKAIFGDEDPINKLIKLDNKHSFKVSGVFKDFPHNSEFSDVHFLLPWSYYESDRPWVKNSITNWDNNSFQIYAQLQDNSDVNKIAAKVKGLLNGHDRTDKPEVLLHPISKWHLYGEFKDGKNIGGAIEVVWMFGIIGFFVLLLACINFMNLSTARSEKRAKEVGIRKAVGSMRKQLIFQFLSESVLIALLACCLSLLFVELSLPWFNQLADKTMQIDWNNGWFWFALLSFTIITGLIAGSYPAFYLSSFNSVKVLKGSFKAGRLASLPRKILVVTQFTVSVSLIICTIVIYQQIQFAKKRPVGYSRAGMLTVNMNTPDLFGHYTSMRDDLINSGAAINMAESSSPTTDVWNNQSEFEWKEKDPAFVPTFGTIRVTHDFGKTIGWQIKEGRDFSREFATDTASMIINEAAAQYMGLKNPIGEIVRHKEGENTYRDFKIIGVAKNMVIESPFDPAKPMLYTMDYDDVSVIIVKVNPLVSMSAALPKIEAIFKKYNPGAPFDYAFASDEYAKKFSNEMRIGKLATFFAIFAIFISCLGLFGLSSFTAEQRVKEIGVRKVLGASVFNLWKLLSIDFLFLVFISLFIAVPIAYYFMRNWLQHYNYRIGISAWVFIATGIMALIITLITVSFQAIKAAIANPVKSLRTE